MMDERRSVSRIRADRPVRLYHLGTNQVVETLTKDLAPGGMRCLSSTLFPVSTELNLELVFSDGEEPFMVRGRTVWFRTIPQSEQFDLGIAFLDIPPANKRRLSVYLDRLAAHSSSVPV